MTVLTSLKALNHSVRSSSVPKDKYKHSISPLAFFEVTDITFPLPSNSANESITVSSLII